MVEKKSGDKRIKDFLRQGENRNAVCTRRCTAFEASEITIAATHALALAKKIVSQITQGSQRHSSHQLLKILSARLDTRKAIAAIEEMRHENSCGIFIL